jgi:hypothetical protein
MSDNIKKKLEKIFEGKKLSDDSKLLKPKKKRVKARKSKICTTCNEHIIENEDRDALRFTNTFHQLQTKQYCDSHESTYHGHKCKPHWCGDCGFLMNYDIEISK